MTISHKGTVKRLLCYGLDPSSAVQVTTYIENLIKNNGPEWTISRLKTIKVGYLNYLSGITPEWGWVKCKAGLPAGPLHSIFDLHKPHKILNCLMVYSQLISPKVSEKQWLKFSNSVRFSRERGLELFKGFNLVANSFIGSRHLSTRLLQGDLLIGKFFSSVRSPDMYAGFKTAKSTPKLILEQFNHLIARSFINKHLSGVLPDFFIEEVSKQWSQIHYVLPALEHKETVGRISFLQEPGYKLRAIANPLPCFQLLLNPLKDDLLTLLGNLENDFTMDQEAGVLYIQGLLRDGIKVSSVDLSDATNFLPLKDQINVLKSIYGNNPFIDLFEEVSTSDWVCSSPEGDIKIKWMTGQPLGLGPSFPSFALYHHFIVRMVICNVEGSVDPLRHLYDELSGERQDVSYNYAIVGDDIVIDQKYASEYLRIISALECKVSLEKCIFNSSTAEFCSRFITKDKILRQFKWKVPTDKSYLDMAKQFGPSILPLLRPKQREILKVIGEIPDTLKGPVGWNPHGKPLAQREAELWKIAEELEELKSPYNPSVPRNEIHYLLKRELGMIHIKSLTIYDHLNDQNNRVSCDPRQSFMSEMAWRLSHSSSESVKVALFSAIELAGGFETLMKSLTSEERRDLNYVHSLVNEPGAKIHWEDPNLSKLYSLIQRYQRQSKTE
jgi:hypothetical protein